MQKDNDTKANNEIDLFDLLIKFVRFTRKNIIFIAICLLMGLLLSITYFYSQSKKYELTLLLEYKVISQPVIYEIIASNINSNPIEKNSNRFNTSNYTTINKINIDTSNQNFHVKLILSDTNNYRAIITNFMHAINTDNYLVKITSKYIDNKKTLLNELARKIAELDSIQKQIKNNLFANKKDFISVNPYYTEYFRLFEWKTHIENDLNSIIINKEINPIYIIKEELSPVKSDFLLILIISLFTSLLMAYIILFVIKIWKLSK